MVSTNIKTITIENNGVGYYLYVSNPNLFEVNQSQKIYLHKRVSMSSKNTINEELYGFKYYDEKNMFMKLLQVSGIGPKTAINICRNDPRVLRELIASHNVEALEKLNGITPKIAKLMIDGCEIEQNQTVETKSGDLISALKALGYFDKEISYAVENISCASCELSDLISEAIKIIARRNEFDHLKT